MTAKVLKRERQETRDKKQRFYSKESTREEKERVQKIPGMKSKEREEGR